MCYPKRSIVVQAYQMTEERTRRRSQWPFWLQEAWLVDRMWFESPSRFMLETREGPVEVAHGDWIIQGITGELYPCEPDIFEANYEKEESDPECHTACIRRTINRGWWVELDFDVVVEIPSEPGVPMGDTVNVWIEQAIREKLSRDSFAKRNAAPVKKGREHEA